MSDFKAPHVNLGDIVYWRNDGSSPPTAAIVSSVGQRTLCLHILSPDSSTPKLRDGVFHVSDPHRLREGNKDAGVWELRDLSAFPSSEKPTEDFTPIHNLKGGKR